MSSNAQNQGAAPTFLVIAGEISGDHHAAALVEAVSERMPGSTFFGIGGELMRGQGVETLYDVPQMAVMGIWEVLIRYPFFRRVFNDMLKQAEQRRPTAVILVDYPGFNLRFAEQVRKLGIPVFYYICPQVWAWKASRIPKIARVVDHLFTIFPFEPACFEGTDLKVDFVGHPLVDQCNKSLARPPESLPWTSDTRVALLPGSREHEIQRMLPVLWEAAVRIEQRKPDAAFLVPTPSEAVDKIVRRCIEEQPESPRHWQTVIGNTHQVLRQATAALVTSGTATLDACLMDCPMVITYRVAPLTYLIGRAVVRISHIGLVNIVGQRTICPELIQHEATPAKLADALLPLLDDTPARRDMLDGLAEVREKLGDGGSARNAAEWIARDLDR